MFEFDGEYLAGDLMPSFDIYARKLPNISCKTFRKKPIYLVSRIYLQLFDKDCGFARYCCIKA